MVVPVAAAVAAVAVVVVLHESLTIFMITTPIPLLLSPLPTTTIIIGITRVGARGEEEEVGEDCSLKVTMEQAQAGEGANQEEEGGERGTEGEGVMEEEEEAVGSLMATRVREEEVVTGKSQCI